LIFDENKSPDNDKSTFAFGQSSLLLTIETHKTIIQNKNVSNVKDFVLRQEIKKDEGTSNNKFKEKKIIASPEPPALTKEQQERIVKMRMAKDMERLTGTVEKSQIDDGAKKEEFLNKVQNIVNSMVKKLRKQDGTLSKMIKK
jgi:hypothetical protein